MNKITRAADIEVPKVTTGPLPASSKVYSSPEAHPDVRVPFREIALSPGSGEPAFRVYDPSGPYTDASATMMNTITVVIAVSRREGQVTFDTSVRTCCRNSNGFVVLLAIGPSPAALKRRRP